MSKNLLTLILLFCFAVSSAQTVSNVNFDEIKATINKTGSDGYSKLLKRASSMDSILTAPDYKILYYGQAFQPTYKPYSNAMVLQPAMKLYQEGKVDDALALYNTYLQSNPLDLRAIYSKLSILYQQQKQAEMQPLMVLLKNLLKTITDSGDGKTVKTAMVVMTISDEYIVMSSLGVKPEKQALTAGSCDLMTLQPNNANLTELYFNVSQPMATLSRMMK